MHKKHFFLGNQIAEIKDLHPNRKEVALQQNFHNTIIEELMQMH